MSTFDAATATLIADRYLRQHLNTAALSHTWRSQKGHSSRVQTDICTHRQELLPSFILTCSLSMTFTEHSKGGLWCSHCSRGLGRTIRASWCHKMPDVQMEQLCSERYLQHVTKSYFKSFPPCFCTQIKSGLFIADKKCSSRTRTEVIGLGAH